MLFKLVATLTPVPGAWSDDCEERLVGHVLIEADNFHEALSKAHELGPEVVGDVTAADTGDLLRRAFHPREAR